MASLAAQFPSLDTLGQGAATGLYFGDQFNAAQRNNQINQQAALQDMYHKEQMNPLNVKQAQANIDSTTESTRGAKVKNDFDVETYDVRVKQKLKELARMATDDDIKMLDNQADTLMRSRDPGQQALGKEMFNMSAAMHKFRTEKSIEHKNKMAEIGAQSANAQEVARINARSRLDVKNAGSGPGGFDPGSILKSAMSGKLNFEKAATMFETASVFEQDPQKAALYQEMAKRFGQAVVNKKPPDLRDIIDLSQIGGIPVKEQPPVTPALGQGKPNAPVNPQPTQPAVDPAINQIKASVESAGWKFEPDQYDYRIGPGGVPQRKRKVSK